MKEHIQFKDITLDRCSLLSLKLIYNMRYVLAHYMEHFNTQEIFSSTCGLNQ